MGTLDIVTSPIMQIRALDVDIQDFDIALITSSQALRSLPGTFQANGRLALCVGDVTTQAANSIGFAAVCAGSTVDGLVDHVLAHLRQGRYLHLRGQHTTGDLVPRLDRHGVQVQGTIVYDQPMVALSESAQQMLQRGTPVVLPLFSPRSAELLIEQMTISPVHRAICISKNTVQICQDAGFSVIRVAQTPTAQDMVVTTLQAAHQDFD